MRAVLQFLSSPVAIARDAAREGRGLGALFALLALEVVIAQPRVWVGALMRFRAAPGPSFTVLYGAYTRAAVPVFVTLGCLGLARYYWGRWRRWPRMDSLAAAHAFSHVYLPHVLIVCVGGVLAAMGVASPWLPQMPLGALPAGWERWAKLTYTFAPSAIYLGAVWRALKPPVASSAEASASTSGTATSTSGTAASVAVSSPFIAASCAGLLGLGVVATLWNVGSHWSQYRPRALGEPMPAFAVQGIDRPDVSSVQTMGAPLVIDFWATWCPPCIAALPHVQELSRAYEARGVRFLAVNVESDNRAGVEAFVRAKRLTLPVYIDLDGLMQEAFHVHVYPTTWVVTRDGRIDKIYSGSVSAEELRSEIETLLEP